MINFARWFFLGILIYAPWAYGCTREWAIVLANYLIWSCGVLCLIGWFAERHLPRLTFAPIFCLALLISQATWMWFNALAEYDTSYFQFVFLSPPRPDLPGSWNKEASLSVLPNLVSLAVAFVIVSDLVSDRLWRQRLWTTLGLAGISIVLFGLAQRAFHAPSIFWLNEKTGTTFFGPYRYHANAGAYLNLVWPVLAILTVEAWQEKERYVARAIWLGALLLSLCACFINVSRGASGVTALLILPALLVFRPFFREQLIFLTAKNGIILLLLFGLFVGALLLSGTLYQTQYRWGLFEQQHQLTPNNPRLLVDQATFRMVPFSGWFGFGPGTFSTMFPYFSGYLGKRIWGFWVYAHQDYLQTLVEYGYLGTALWSFLFFGGLAKLVRGSFNHRLRTMDRIECRGASLAIAGVALHSLFDFPLQVYSIQLYVITILAYAWTRTRATKRKRSVESPQEVNGPEN